MNQSENAQTGMNPVLGNAAEHVFSQQLLRLLYQSFVWASG